jgi:hypothetical protein
MHLLRDRRRGWFHLLALIYALAAHQRWWEVIWRAQLAVGCKRSTMTPEFGPDGYLHQIPFSAEPVADLWHINGWMRQCERAHFKAFMTETGR